MSLWQSLYWGEYTDKVVKINRLRHKQNSFFVYYFQLRDEMSKAVLIPECNKDIGGIKEEICISPSDKKDGAIGLISRFFRLDALGKRHSADSPPATETSAKYYGVYIPCEDKKGPDVGK